jgi:hypothetical protein
MELMTRKEKLREKLFRSPKPKDFTWTELITLLEHMGFQVEPNAAGSSHHSIFHPSSKVKAWISKPHRNGKSELISYQIDDVKEVIKKAA